MLVPNKEELRGWLELAKSQGATHLLVVCDEFDWEDYPVFVMPGDNLTAKAFQYDGVNMQRIMECYDLAMDFDSQLNEERALHGWRPTQTSTPH